VDFVGLVGGDVRRGTSRGGGGAEGGDGRRLG